MSQTMYMFDDTNIALDPPNAYAYAGYVDGAYANFSALQKKFPKAHLLSITVFGADADCYDIEPGDGTNADVYNWFVSQEKHGVWRPCIYTAASNMAAMQTTMKANGFARSSYRMWSAHYTGKAHCCAPWTCGYGLDQADATQFTDRALGRSLDESIVADDFFPPAPSINPVRDLEVTRRGFTSIDLSWKAASGAVYYTVKAYNRGKLRRTVKATLPSARVGYLLPTHTYEFRVRAHPSGSVGTDASVHGTTR